MSKPNNVIRVSQLTGRWYFILSWRPDGSARRKIDITEEMERVKREMQFEWDLLRDAQPESALAAVKPAK